MKFALSTHWNVCRHSSGEALVEEILQLGFDAVELGYNLTVDLVPGVLRMVQDRAVRVTSVHNYCPVPIGAPQGHPELFLLSSSDRRVRDSAILHIRKTIDFAAEVGAGVVVLHAGRVEMHHFTNDLIRLCESNRQYDGAYEKKKLKLLLQREKKAPRHLERVYTGLELLLPALEANRVKLALEILPSWEAIPSEAEMEQIGRRFDSPWLGYWYDIGHGQIRDNLGLVSSIRWLERLESYLAGMHIHDAAPPAFDHLMPPRGKVNFSLLKPWAQLDIPLVLEPVPGTPAEHILEGVALLREAWFAADGSEAKEQGGVA